MISKTALVIDFDGTITDDDFFVYIKNEYFDDAALEPWRRYLNGELTHFQALQQIFGLLRVSEVELKRMIATIKVDSWVEPLFRLCAKAQIIVFIASAGCDYYIKQLLGDVIRKYNVTLIANSGVYSADTGLVLTPPTLHSPYYDEKTGISKRKLVKMLKDGGYYVIFAGDGPPDIEPAGLADVVFAKKMLLDMCVKQGIVTQNFDSCEDICTFIMRIKG